MLSLALLSLTFVCLLFSPLNLWAVPLAFALFFLYPAWFWSALGLAGLAGFIYLFRRKLL